MSAARLASRRPAAALLACALLAAAPAPACADDAAQPVPAVNVNAIKDPEMRSYRSIEAGLDAFDEYRRLAPDASLRFRLHHNNGAPAGAADGLQLRLASDDASVEAAIPIDDGGAFTLARNPAAYRADASFILNRKNGLYSAHPEVRTPGLPANVRRLGDLRLECRVTVAIVKEQIPFLAKAAINTLLLTTDWCGKEDVNIGFPVPATLTGVVLQAGTRSRALRFSDWNYQTPVGDRSWPDDALVEFTYGDAAPTRTADETPRTAP